MINKISIRKNNTHLNTSFLKGNLNRNKTLKMFKLRRRSCTFRFLVFMNVIEKLEKTNKIKLNK